LGEKNSVFKILITEFSKKAIKDNLSRDDAYQKALSKFVAKMEIQMTMPEEAVVQQEDVAGKSSNPEETDPMLYFIANGNCEVTVRINHDL
jgi:hypothetical protein